MELDSAKAVSPEGGKGSCSWPGCFEGRGQQDAVTSGWRGAGCGRVLPTPTPQKVKVCRGRKGWLRRGCCTEELGLPGSFGRSSVTSKRGDSNGHSGFSAVCSPQHLFYVAVGGAPRPRNSSHKCAVSVLWLAGPPWGHHEPGLPKQAAKLGFNHTQRHWGLPI